MIENGRAVGIEGGGGSGRMGGWGGGRDPGRVRERGQGEAGIEPASSAYQPNGFTNRLITEMLLGK